MTDTATESQPTEAAYGEAMGALFELMGGFMTGHVLRTGLELGLFEALGAEPKAAGEIASALGLEPEHTRRLLRALAQTDFVTEEPGEAFSLAPLGRYLEDDHPDSIGDGIRFWFHPKLEAAWAHLPAMIAEGPPDGFKRAFGKSLWQYLEDDEELSGQFHRFMAALRDRRSAAAGEILADYDFGAFSHVCDVGGGHGHLLSHLLKEHPHLEGTVLDLPNAIEQDGRRWASKLGVAGRCTYQAGDMLEEVPTADAYFLQGILNSIPKADATQVLSNIHAAAPSGARVFILEPMAPDSAEPDFAKLFDIQLMITSEGGSRTPDEYQSMLERAGLDHVRTEAPEEAMFSMIEASTP
jgi:hypothetical protein